MRVACAVAFAALLAASSAARGYAQVLQATGNLPLPGVEGRIDHLAATPDGERLFVAALGSDLVAAIDTARRQVSGAIRGIKEPQGVYFIAASGTLVVAGGGDATVRFYDRNLRLAGAVGGLADADNVRYDPTSGLIYVGYGEGGLAIIDPTGAVKVGDIALDGHPESFQLETHGGRIFVNVPAADEIEVIDRARRVVLTRWKLTAAGGNFPMALDEADQRVLVGCRTPARLLALNTTSGKVVAKLRACGDADDLFYDSARRAIYLSGGAGCVSVFTRTVSGDYEESRTIATPQGSRTSLFVPSAHTLYVAAPRRGSRPAELLSFKPTPAP